MSEFMKPYFTILALVLFSTMLNGGAVITANPVSHSFARFPANQQKKCIFHITNTGDAPLRIEKIRTSCSCANAEISSSDIAPGSGAQLVATIPPEGISGPFSHGIFIHSNAENERIKMLSISGEACPLVVVQPSDKLYLGTLKSGTVLSKRFIMNVSMPTEFNSPAISGCPSATAVLTKIDETHWALDFKWDVTAEEKNFSCKIDIGVKFPIGWKPIKIILQGRIE